MRLWQVCNCLLGFFPFFPPGSHYTVTENKEKKKKPCTWTPMKAFILSLVTRRPLTVPVTGFSKEAAWNMAAFCRDVLFAPSGTKLQYTTNFCRFYRAASGELRVNVFMNMREFECVLRAKGGN